MNKKSFKITCEIQLKIICVPNLKLCKYDHIYINVEIFGETQKSKLMHPYFPIMCTDKFYFEKMLWSPETKTEAFKLLKESPVSVELRHLKSDCPDSILLAFMDSNAFEFLVADSDYTKDSISLEKPVELIQSDNKSGLAPKLKFSIRTTITCTKSPVIDELLLSFPNFCKSCERLKLKKLNTCPGGHIFAPQGDLYSCDCELHQPEGKNQKHCKICHQDMTLNICDQCHQKLEKKAKEFICREISDFEHDRNDNNIEKIRPPFVVRKVPYDLVGRKPGAFDSHYNAIIRTEAQRRSLKQKKLQRTRSCSPVKSRSNALNTSKCYACFLPGDDVRISCDACNLTHRGERSNRNSEIIRPEPPVLQTYREPVDQKPLYCYNKPTCSKCKKIKIPSLDFCQDNSLCTNSRPLYLLDGYQHMAKYFPPVCSH